MSEVELETVEQPTTVSMEEFNELKAQFENLTSSKDRILSESKDYKSKYNTMRKEQEAKQVESMEKKEEWKDLLEQERSKSYELEGKYKSAQKKAVLKDVNFQVSRLAGDAHDVDDVINSLNLTEDQINFDTGEVNGISGLIDGLRKNKPYLFKTDVPKMNQTNPKFKEEKKEMSETEALHNAFTAIIKPRS